jgi:CBS domain-containing protein
MLEDAPITAGEIMTKDVAFVHPETPLKDAVKLMSQRQISGMPVLDDDGHVIGMFSEGDLVRWHEGLEEKYERWLDMLADGHTLAPTFLEAIRAAHYQVRSVMSHGATTVTEDTSARAIANMLYAKGINRVPVLRDGRLVGIVARSDLVRALAKKLDEPPPPSPEHISIDESLRRRRQEKAV